MKSLYSRGVPNDHAEFWFIQASGFRAPADHPAVPCLHVYTLIHYVACAGVVWMQKEGSVDLNI